jgi:hypothetical protein
MVALPYQWSQGDYKPPTGQRQVSFSNFVAGAEVLDDRLPFFAPTIDAEPIELLPHASASPRRSSNQWNDRWLTQMS